LAFVSNTAHAERLEQNTQTKTKKQGGTVGEKTQKADRRFSDNLRKEGRAASS
jgi:hypothetical protein